MNGKEFLTAAVTMAAMMTLYRESHAASGVVELEIPGMNALTAAAISDFSANPCPETVAAIRTSVASNYDGVVVRKAEKRDELQAEADALVVELGRMISTNAPFAQISRQEKLIEERQSLVDDMTEHHKGTGILKRAVEPSTLFGFWFQGFMVSFKSGSGSLSGSIFNHGTHRTHGKAWHCFRVFSVFRGSNQKLRSAPNRYGEDLNGSQCLQAFAQNPHAQLPFLR